jgi:hypothetical protein
VLLTTLLQCGQEPSDRCDGRFSATLGAEGGTHRPYANGIDHPEATQGEGYEPERVEGAFSEGHAQAAQPRRLLRGAPEVPEA